MHIKGHNCRKCYNETIKNRYTQGDFINDSTKVHGNKYDYSLVEYINAHKKVKIICKKHGIFEQKACDHIHAKCGCPKCCKNSKKDTEYFIKKSKEIHGNKYDYSISKYIDSYTKIKIICPKHGTFEQKPNIHLQGCGCQKCNESKGEREISKILEKYNIRYIREKRFKKCKNITILPFDFYLIKENICIEFDGYQHYNIIEKWGGEKNLKEIQMRDKIKNKFCEKNNIKLIRIKYDCKNIEEELLSKIFESN